MLDAYWRRIGLTKSANVVAPNLHGHIPALDGIRGMAILVVLLHHSNYTEHADSLVLKAIQRFFASGWVGVDLFFVLSGFLITGILSDAKGRGRYFTEFYMRRVLRIFPLYYGAVAMMLLVFPYLFPAHPEARAALARNQIWYWTYLINYVTVFVLKGWPPYGTGHFWSLAVEEQFYLIWPLLIFALSRKGALYVSMVLVGVGPMCRVFCLEAFAPLPFNGTLAGGAVANYIFLPARMDALAIGATIALAARGPGGLVALLPPLRWLLPSSLIVLAVLAVVNHGSLIWFDRPTQIVGYSALGLAFGALLVIGALSPRTTPVGRVTQNAFLRFLGRFSYSIYIFHVPIMLWLHDHWSAAGDSIAIHGSKLLGQVVFTLVGSSISVAFALFTWYAYEVHFLKLKRFFDYSRRQRPVSD
jgi:peptidoglycan/LPS O-acetylase OafA/YrhL